MPEENNTLSRQETPANPGVSFSVLSPSSENIQLLSNCLRNGEIVAVPTETVYGLAANALDPAACERIFEAKGRPHADPLIVHVSSIEQAKDLAHFNEKAELLAAAFWPGALTLILPKKSCVPDIVTASLNTVAIRLPGHPAFRKLIEACQIPLAAPSANPFGYVSPTSVEHVTNSLGDRIHWILDGGPCEIGIESTIIDLSNQENIRILRPGGISPEAIGEVLSINPASLSLDRHLITPSATGGLIAPGLLERHYSPNTLIQLHPHGTCFAEHSNNPTHAYVSFKKQATLSDNCFSLSDDGSTKQAASRLFEMLRSLDHQPWSRIHIEKAPDTDIGIAINDRLQRAASR